MAHTPVLCAEAVAALAPCDGDLIVDATFGAGGYSRAILAAADCRVVGLDRDPDAESRAGLLAADFGSRFRFVAGRFGELERLVGEPADGVVFDLGVSSFQFDEGARGFSFQQDAPLDMRMGAAGPTAADAVNKLSEAALADLIRDYGEDDDARRIARGLVQARAAAPIARTLALADVVDRAVGGRRGAKTHPATKTFQALRLLVNDELVELARGLAGAERALKPGGRLVAVSFHSLEDGFVKRFLAARAGFGSNGSRHAPEGPPPPPPSFRLGARRPITPGADEIAANPRARSASLRWAVRTEAPAWPEDPAEARALKARSEWEQIG
jgi:16S rRNA (cytosine1402-N4)-methyltransferase